MRVGCVTQVVADGCVGEFVDHGLYAGNHDIFVNSGPFSQLRAVSDPKVLDLTQTYMGGIGAMWVVVICQVSVKQVQDLIGDHVRHASRSHEFVVTIPGVPVHFNRSREIVHQTQTDLRSSRLVRVVFVRQMATEITYGEFLHQCLGTGWSHEQIRCGTLQSLFDRGCSEVVYQTQFDLGLGHPVWVVVVTRVTGNSFARHLCQQHLSASWSHVPVARHTSNSFFVTGYTEVLD